MKIVLAYTDPERILEDHTLRMAAAEFWVLIWDSKIVLKSICAHGQVWNTEYSFQDTALKKHKLLLLQRIDEATENFPIRLLDNKKSSQNGIFWMPSV